MAKRWYTAKMTARCEMAVWVEAEDASAARELLDNLEYDEMTDWEPVDHSTYRRGRVTLAPDFEPHYVSEVIAEVAAMREP